MLESDIERPAKEYARCRRWVVAKIMVADRNGFPDDLFLRDGKAIFIEFKKPGEDARRQQKKRHEEIRQAGFEVFVVDNLDVAKEILF